MIAAVLLSAVGALTFVEQTIPGVPVGGLINSIGGTMEKGFRHADVDGDGTPDLVLPREIYLLRGGRFVTQRPLSVPKHPADALCDLWGSDFYLVSPGHLTVVRWEDGVWKRLLNQALAWSGGEPAHHRAVPRDSDPASGSSLHFSRFLQDIDGDHRPEIVLAAEDGIHIFARRNGGYRLAKVLNVFPPLRYSYIPRQRLWPPEARRIAFPARQMHCTFVLNGVDLRVIWRTYVADKRVIYHITRYTLDPGKGYSPDPAKTTRSDSAAMPAYMEPCVLRPGGEVDFAGGDWEYSESSALPRPIFVTEASTDNGSHCQSVRAPFYRPQCSFVDMNGDGRLDMVTEASDLFDGGIRETVERYMSGTTLHHELRVYLQDARGRFPRAPSFSAGFRIALQEPPVHNSDRFRWYESGELLNVTGDLNGDGYRDVVVHDQLDRLAVYLNKGRGSSGGAGGFSSKPDATIAIGPHQRFEVTDLDGDGRSDIVVWWRDTTTNRPVERSRVYLSRESGP